MHADDVRGEKINGLPEHSRLGLDAADAPTHDPETINHRGVRVGPHQGVREGNPLAIAEHALGEILQVHLMDDADARRHDLERIERLHTPLEKFVALAIARKLKIEVLRQSIGRAREIHLHRVVDDEVNGDERFDDLRILPELHDRRAHRGQIDQQRHPSEVLQDNARDDEGYLLRARGLRIPTREVPDGGLGDALAVAIAQQRLQHEADRDRQARNLKAGLLQSRQGIEFVRHSVGGERLQGIEGIRKAHEKYAEKETERAGRG